MAAPRRIGVLTGGGDCPGLNAVIRAVTKDALFHGCEVFGVEDGFLGLIENRVRPLGYEDVSNILTTGGTILGSSNKANPGKYAVGCEPDGSVIFKDMTDQCMQHVEERGLDVLVVIGGDGTMTCTEPFAKRGLNCIGVPKTIDNDIEGTDLTFGFLTACHIATEALDRVHTTAFSHSRCLVVEVMGRNAGWIALHSGIASGADVILIPEIPFDLAKVCETVEQRRRAKKRFTVVCVAEGARPADGEQIVRKVDSTSPDPVRLGGIAAFVAQVVEQETGVESRHVVLGHVQRGGTPVAADRVLATQFGHHAMQLVKAGQRGRMVAWRGGQLTDIDITEPAGKQRTIPLSHPLLAAGRSVYTYFGE